MARRTDESFWDRFSRVGLILIVLYLLCIALGFAIRLIFFSEEKTTSIVPANNAVVSAAGTNEESAATTEPAESAAVTKQNILRLDTDKDYLAVLEGDSAPIAVNMSTTGQADENDLSWSTSDSAVATVDQNGNVTGVQAGECTITVSVTGNPAVSKDILVHVRHLSVRDGCTYVDGILVINKTYGVPETYDPGLYDEVAAAFEEMRADAAADGMNLYIGSSYRDYAYQVEIYNNYADLYGWEQADTFSARPGYSEHQSGFVIDCNTIDDAFGETPEAAWLAEHCEQYGFIVRYPEGKEDITGYKYEPWHIRYVGSDVAQEIKALGVCLEEYLGVDSVYQTPWVAEATE